MQSFAPAIYKLLIGAYFISDYCANLFHYDATSCHLNGKWWNKEYPILILQQKKKAEQENANANRWCKLSFSLFIPVHPCCSPRLWEAHARHYLCRWKQERPETTNNNNIKLWTITSLQKPIGQSFEMRSWTLQNAATRHSEKKQAHRLAAQWWCVPAAEHQQTHLAALSGYRCTAVYTNRTQVLLQAWGCGNTASYEIGQT